MSDEQYDYAPKPSRGRKAKPAASPPTASPPAARKRGEGEAAVDYTPRPARREPAARAPQGKDAAPRSARPTRKKGAASRPPQRIKLSSLLRSRALMAAGGIMMLIVLVVVPAIAELTRGGTSSTPTGSPVDLGNQYYDKGSQLWNQGDYAGAYDAFQQAASYYEQALTQTPEDAQIRTDLGTMYLYQGILLSDTVLMQQAIQTWNEALQYAPDKPETLLNLGLGYAQLGQTAQALAAWQRVIEVAPGSDTAQRAQQFIQEYAPPPNTTP